MWCGKRLIESILVAGAAPLWLPLVALVALVVWTVDGSPILFCQSRRGLQGRVFRMMKFRTMKVDPLRTTARVSVSSPEVTKVGRFLRVTKADELPQLFHVLSGRMALVGPRPLPDDGGVSMLAGSEARWAVRPGVTGLAQVSGGINLSLEDRLALDLLYARSASPWLDASILLKTMLPRRPKASAC
jgi:lipopolysaccharide/colanic/teichoic acid biosynthesis glycosyltransferase